MDMTGIAPSPNLALQQALVAALESGLRNTVNGIYDSAPVQAREPYVTVGDAIGTDWSARAFSGEDIRLAISVHDDRRDRERLSRIGEAVAYIVDNMSASFDGGRIVLYRIAPWPVRDIIGWLTARSIAGYFAGDRNAEGNLR